MTVTSPPGQAARRARTRERLLDAAFEVFAEHGFGGSSLELICERAGLTRGAFHYNFANREELFLAVNKREFEFTMESLRNLPAMPQPGEDPGDPELLLEMLQALYSNDAHKFITWSLLSEEFRLFAMRDAEAAKSYTEFHTLIHETLGASLEQIATAHKLTMLAPPTTVAAIVVGTYLRSVSEGVLAGADRETIQRTGLDRALVIVKGLMPRVTP